MMIAIITNLFLLFAAAMVPAPFFVCHIITDTTVYVKRKTRQRIASKKAGEVAVTYSSGTSSSSVSVNTDLADLTETDFGLQLLSLLRLYARPVYVP